MKAEEGYIEVPGDQVWYRAVGDEADAIPLLCLHGGPGFTHYYLEALESLADRRRVIFYDQLGCGRSDRPGDLTLWERGPVRGGTGPGPFGPQARPPAPVRQLLGRHAGHAVRP